MSSRFEDYAFFDLEITDSGLIREFGTILNGSQLHGKKVNAQSVEEMGNFISKAKVIVGHNIIAHDLEHIGNLDPRNPISSKPVLDTLRLSPICFPENPYHKLVKGYKLEGDSRSDPIKDCELAHALLNDEINALSRLNNKHPKLASTYRKILSETENQLEKEGLDIFFDGIGVKKLSDDEDLKEVLKQYLHDKVCEQAFLNLLEDDVFKKDYHAYLLSWLLVAGSNSILPYWVCYQYPHIIDLVYKLRETPCENPSCEFCLENHSSEKQLKKFFGFDSYRMQPATADGNSLQKSIVEAGLENQPILAILPTGGGKSLCFQIPALVNHYRSGGLTIVLSPLQALIKDQVDNLRKQTGMHSSIDAIYGLQTGPERGGVYERLHGGDTAILYVSPEQLRNKRFKEAIAKRQISRWVFDEAHCLSKWGHDFRPDYTYAGRFIRELSQRQGVPIPPISCLTATAKNDVKQELLQYFEKELNQSLELLDGGTERGNLSYDVSIVSEPQKPFRAHELLLDHLPSRKEGAAVVFCSTRASVERLAGFLEEREWEVAPFHAGIATEEKGRLLEAFNSGDLQVICATNAFGMGVDKPDIRLVIHHDIPGSLENYIQEAGRGGRDQEPAHCVLLYNPGSDGKGGDIDTQFSMDTYGRISKNDVRHILRSIRYRVKKQSSNNVEKTPYAFLSATQILEEITTSFDDEYGTSKRTKVSTAISNLENTGFLKRDQNQTRVFQGLPLVHNMEEAIKIIIKVAPNEERHAWQDIYHTFLNLPKGTNPELEQFTEIPSLSKIVEKTNGDATRTVFKILNTMASPSVKLIQKDIGYSATLAHKQGEKSSNVQLKKLGELESVFIKLLQEEFPDAESGESYPLNIRVAVGVLRHQGFSWCLPTNLSKILTMLRMDGTGLAGGKGSIVPRELGQDQYKIRLQTTLSNLRKISEKRLQVSQFILEQITAKIPEKERGMDLSVNFTESELLEAISKDMYSDYRDPHAAIEHGLRYLHEMNIIQIKGGLGLITQAMRIELNEDSKKRRYSNADHKSLEVHYKEKNLQIHVMEKYAKLGASEIARAIGFVLDYFGMDKKSFVQKHFKGSADILNLATSSESFQRIVESLENPFQQAIVADEKESNMLILAGPGSGKTKTVAHRCAYLIRVERVRAESILVLCYNRSAAMTLRKRIRDLCDRDANGITICTYHSLALRILGLSAEFAFKSNNDDQENQKNFDEIIPKATELLEGKVETVGMDHEQLLNSILGRWNHILIDEYQDIDSNQYNFVSSIAGRLRTEDEFKTSKKLSILAVGDDDQNIYQFRGANTQFIKKFESDYEARRHNLLQNYRSSANIIQASNELISQNVDRMKTDDPIRINDKRKEYPSGGRWESMDDLSEGLVQIIPCNSLRDQPGFILNEIERLRKLDSDATWKDFAILGRTRKELEPVRSLLETKDIQVEWRCGHNESFPLHRLREVRDGIEILKKLESKKGSEPLVTFDEIKEEMSDFLSKDRNQWKELFNEIINDWGQETGDSTFPVQSLINFIFEAFFQLKADQKNGTGIYVGTIHSAKGMEFKNVFVLDGGWHTSLKNIEEERRLYYVAMTRAMENLVLLDSEDSVNPFSKSLFNTPSIFQREKIQPKENWGGILDRKYEILGMKDLYLDLGSKDQIVMMNISKLEVGEPVKLTTKGKRVIVTNQEEKTIAYLSQSSSERWKTRLDSIHEARVLAIIKRSIEDVAEEYKSQCLFTSWEIPLIEIVV
ncbi:RecQ family ATP-dependent DNA helicase [Opitutales bacterium]|nr:RecQ family ATP-dependent DNA helicase [Opitutales bacterium]